MHYSVTFWKVMHYIAFCYLGCLAFLFFNNNKKSYIFTIHYTLSLKFSSKMFARWKINTTSRYVNHVYTLPPKFSSIIKNSDRVRVFAFFASVASILRGILTVQSHRTSERQNPERWLSNSSTSSRSTKHCKNPCTRSSQKLVVFILMCGSIASKASNWATDILK